MPAPADMKTARGPARSPARVPSRHGRAAVRYLRRTIIRRSSVMSSIA